MEDLRKAKNESIRTLLTILITGGICFIVAEFTQLGNNFAFKAGIGMGAVIRIWDSIKALKKNGYNSGV